MYICEYVCMYVYVCMCVYIIYIYIYIYIHTQNRVMNCDQDLDNPRVSNLFYACNPLAVGKVPSLRGKS